MTEPEQAEYVNKNYFRGRFAGDGNLNKSNLSTGTKSLLNIINHPDICFDTLECGDNALFALRKIKDGYIVEKSGAVFFHADGAFNYNDADVDIFFENNKIEVF